jgi:hypothetical protein
MLFLGLLLLLIGLAVVLLIPDLLAKRIGYLLSVIGVVLLVLYVLLIVADRHA